MPPVARQALADQAQASVNSFIDGLLSDLDGTVPEFLPYLSVLTQRLGIDRGMSKERLFLLPVVTEMVCRLAAKDAQQ